MDNKEAHILILSKCNWQDSADTRKGDYFEINEKFLRNAKIKAQWGREFIVQNRVPLSFQSKNSFLVVLPFVTDSLVHSHKVYESFLLNDISSMLTHTYFRHILIKIFLEIY